MKAITKFLRRLCLLLGGSFVLILPTQAEDWIDVKDIKGRKLTVLIENVDGDDVTFSTKNGKTFTYKITKFSVVDQLTLRKWKPPVGSNSPVVENAKLGAASDTAAGKIYKTKHFEFEVIGEAAKEKVAEVAPHFEAVHWAFQQLPSNFTPKPAASHFKVKIYAKRGAFEIAAQEKLAEGQPAIYNLSKDILVAPLETLESSSALTREVAYLLLGSHLTKLPPWLAVAVTEYVSSAPFEKNTLNLEDPFENMSAYLSSVYGLANKNMPMLKPSEVLTLDYGSLRADGLEGSKARSSALLTYYFFSQLDAKGKTMERYLGALSASTSPDEAMAALANERDEAQLADALRVAYVPKKLRVAFIK